MLERKTAHPDNIPADVPESVPAPPGQIPRTHSPSGVSDHGKKADKSSKSQPGEKSDKSQPGDKSDKADKSPPDDHKSPSDDKSDKADKAPSGNHKSQPGDKSDKSDKAPSSNHKSQPGDKSDKADKAVVHGKVNTRITSDDLRGFVGNGRSDAIKACVWYLLRECDIPEQRRGTLFLRDVPPNIRLWTAAVTFGLTDALAQKLPLSADIPADESAIGPRSVILDGAFKQAAIQPDGTVRKAYYTDLVLYGESMRGFRDALSKLPVQTPGAYIPDLYDAYRYLFTDRSPGQWQYQPFVTSLIALTRFGSPVDAAFHQRLLDKSVTLYLNDPRFPDADDAAGYPLFRLLWKLSGEEILNPGVRTVYRGKLTECPARRLERILRTARDGMDTLREQWERVETAVPEISTELARRVFADEKLPDYTAQFPELSPDDAFFILSRYLCALRSSPDGVSTVGQDPRRIVFVRAGMRILTADETCLDAAAREFAAVPDVLATLSAGIAEGLPDIRAERWWATVIRANGEGIRKLCETLCASGKIRLVTVEKLLGLRVRMEFGDHIFSDTPSDESHAPVESDTPSDESHTPVESDTPSDEIPRRPDVEILPDDGGLPAVTDAFRYAEAHLSGRPDRGAILFQIWLDEIIRTRRYDALPEMIDALDICLISHAVQERLFRQADECLPLDPVEYAPADVYAAMERWERQISDFTRPRMISRSAAMYHFYTRFTGIRRADASTLRRARELVSDFSALRIRLETPLRNGRFYEDITRKAAAFHDPVLHTLMIFLPNPDGPESLWDILRESDENPDKSTRNPDETTRNPNKTAQSLDDSAQSPDEISQSPVKHNPSPEKSGHQLAVRPPDPVLIEMDCLRMYAARVLSQSARREQIPALVSLYAAGWIPWRTREKKRPGTSVHETVYFISGRSQARLDTLKNVLMGCVEDWIYTHYRPWIAGQVRRYHNRAVPQQAVEDLSAWLDDVGRQIEEQGFAFLREYASGLAGRVKKIALFGYVRRLGLPESADTPSDKAQSDTADAQSPNADTPSNAADTQSPNDDAQSDTADTQSDVADTQAESLHTHSAAKSDTPSDNAQSDTNDAQSDTADATSDTADAPSDTENTQAESLHTYSAAKSDAPSDADAQSNAADAQSPNNDTPSDNDAQSPNNDAQSDNDDDTHKSSGLAAWVRKAAGQVRETAKKFWRR